MTQDVTQDVDALLSAARRPEAAVPVCLRGDLLADIEAAEAELADTIGDDRLSSRRTDITDHIEQLRQQMNDATLTLRFRGMPWREWNDLEAAHPPRKNDDGEPVGQDADNGFNVDGVIIAAIPKCLVDPPMTQAQIDAMLDAITQGQYNHIAATISALNRHRVSVPFSVLASAARNSGENSKQPGPGESPDAGSTGGNPDQRLGIPTTSTDE